MDKIDITTIATIRPDILRTTLGSLKKYLCYPGGFRLILDIAPVGEKGRDRVDVIWVAKDFFTHQTVRLLDVSHQAEAQKWVWSISSSPQVVQWEDDWQLLRKICVREVCSIFADPTVAMVSFDREGKSAKDYSGYKNMFEQVDRNLYRRIKHLNFGGPPAIINREYLKWALPYMRDNECLDVTCERADAQGFLRGWKFYVMTHDDGPLVRDIGKAWMKKNGFKKEKRSSEGFRWQKI
jgi:hypothetical protein